MTRRRRAKPAEGLVDMVSRWPWWLGVTLAVLSFALLHLLSTRLEMPDPRSGRIGGLIVQSFLVSLVSFGQYIVPLICLVGAGFAVWNAHDRKKLVAHATSSDAADVLDGMAWPQFEQLVGEAFRLKGYAVCETGGGGPDGGVDLVLKRRAETYLVQCKHWKAFKVGVEPVRELYGLMAARGAAGGYVVTSGAFTSEAVKFADGRNIVLVDGPKLRGMLQEAAAVAGRPLRRAAVAPPPRAAAASSSPRCPVCSKPMIRREAKRGAHAGKAFWGCTGYPTCKGTRSV